MLTRHVWKKKGSFLARHDGALGTLFSLQPFEIRDAELGPKLEMEDRERARPDAARILAG